MSFFNTRQVSNQVMVHNYWYCVTSCNVHNYGCGEFESQRSFTGSFQWALAFLQELKICFTAYGHVFIQIPHTSHYTMQLLTK